MYPLSYSLRVVRAEIRESIMSYNVRVPPVSFGDYLPSVTSLHNATQYVNTK